MSKTIYRQEHRLLADLLRELREKAGLTQADLAPRLGRPQNRISDFERGGRRIDVIEFLDYCAAIDVSAVSVLNKLQRRMNTAPAAHSADKRRSRR